MSELVPYDGAADRKPDHLLNDEELFERLPDRARRLLADAPQFGSGVLSDNTLKAYRRRIASYMISASVLGFDPSPITPAKVRLHISRLWTVRNRHTSYRAVSPITVAQGVAALKWLIRMQRRGITDPDKLATIPTLGDDLKDAVKEYRKRWTKHWRIKQAGAIPYDKFGDMLDTQDPGTVRGLRNRALLLLLTATGCRPVEAASLDIEHLVWRDDGRVQVLFPKRKNDRGLNRHEPLIRPNRRNRGRCPVAVLEAWLSLLAKHGYVAGCLFFGLPQSGDMPPVRIRLDSRTVGDTLTRIARRAGVPAHMNITGQSGRVTAINWLRMGAVPIDMTAEQVGHASIESTRRYYRRGTYEDEPMMEWVYDRFEQ